MIHRGLSFLIHAPLRPSSLAPPFLRPMLPPRSTAALSTSGPSAPPPAVAIIGGGLAGLAAAGRLAELSMPSIVFDMGMRSAGGRACSRDLPDQGLSFDHGAQCLAPVGEEFTAQVRRWEGEGAVAPWQGRFGSLCPSTMAFSPSEKSGTGTKNDFCGALAKAASGTIFVGTPGGQGALAQHLAKQLEGQGSSVLTGQQITRLQWSPDQRRWAVHGMPRTFPGAPAPPHSSTLLGAFEAVIVADALTALPDSAGYAGLMEGPPGVQAIAKQIQTVSHTPVFSLMAAFELPLADVPFEGACILPDASVGQDTDPSPASRFQWIARNSSKPGRMGGNDNDNGDSKFECWVAVTQNATDMLKEWPLLTTSGGYNPQTREYREAVAAALLADFLKAMEAARAAATKSGGETAAVLPKVVYSHAQRWGRGFVQNPLPENYLGSKEEAFAACGDFCGGATDAAAAGRVTPVEAAWMSGRRAGEAVAAWLVQR